MNSQKFVRGGKWNAAGKPFINPKLVEAGAKVEKEHTSDPATAERIAKDHITEMGAGYYPALDRMEKGLKKKAEAAFIDELQRLAL